jgi:hypothetical protein
MKPIFKAILVVLLFASLVIVAHATVIDYKFPCTNFGTEVLKNNPQQDPDPCPSDTSTSIPNYIRRLYQFSIGISGILAVGMIVAGGILYTVSGGSPDKQNEGKDMIFSALWGLGLLFGAYIILNTINPQLIALKEPGAEQFTGYTNPAETALGQPWGWCEASKLECAAAIQKSNKPSATGISCCLAVKLNTGLADCKANGWGWDNRPNIQKSCCIYGFVTGNCAYGTGPMTGIELEQREVQIRETLRLGGITVNKECYNPTQIGCTNVGLLPKSTIDAILTIKERCNCDVVVTGGAEKAGHTTHGPDKPVVDLKINQQLLDYLKNNNSNILKICTTKKNSAYAKGCGNYYETTEHIHINFK